MKLNVKGLVFVGFAAAVFANAAAFADGDKIVTSKTYVDAKYIGDATTSNTGVVTVSSGTGDYAQKKVITVADYDGTTGKHGLVPTGPSSDKDKKFLRGDGTWVEPAGTVYSEGDGINIDNNNAISADLVGGGNTTVTVGTGTGTGGNGIAEGAIQIKSPTFTQNGDAKTPDSNGVIDFDDTTYETFVAGVGDNAGTDGLVPAPASTETEKFLRGDGQWATPANTTYSFQEGNTNGKFEYSTDGGQSWTGVQVHHAEVTDNKITAINASAASIENGGTGNTTYPTTKAVYDFLTNGASAAGCSDTTPCALVLGSGAPTWQLIQQ